MEAVSQQEITAGHVTGRLQTQNQPPDLATSILPLHNIQKMITIANVFFKHVLLYVCMYVGRWRLHICLCKDGRYRDGKQCWLFDF